MGAGEHRDSGNFQKQPRFVDESHDKPCPPHHLSTRECLSLVLFSDGSLKCCLNFCYLHSLDRQPSENLTRRIQKDWAMFWANPLTPHPPLGIRAASNSGTKQEGCFLVAGLLNEMCKYLWQVSPPKCINKYTFRKKITKLIKIKFFDSRHMKSYII